jgi:hypothetical protein
VPQRRQRRPSIIAIDDKQGRARSDVGGGNDDDDHEIAEAIIFGRARSRISRIIHDVTYAPWRPDYTIATHATLGDWAAANDTTDDATILLWSTIDRRRSPRLRYPSYHAGSGQEYVIFINTLPTQTAFISVKYLESSNCHSIATPSIGRPDDDEDDDRGGGGAAGGARAQDAAANGGRGGYDNDGNDNNDGGVDGGCGGGECRSTSSQQRPIACT